LVFQKGVDEGALPLFLNALTALAEIVRDYWILAPYSSCVHHPILLAVSHQADGDDVGAEVHKVIIIGVELLILQLVCTGTQGRGFLDKNPR
jgi:hypothetical protein